MAMKRPAAGPEMGLCADYPDCVHCRKAKKQRRTRKIGLDGAFACRDTPKAVNQ